MKNVKKIATRIALGLIIGFSIMPAGAETIKKLHSAVQRVINVTSMNDANETNSSTIDLAGGDLDKISYAVSITSAAGTGQLTFTLQVSPDGGTTWTTDASNIKTILPNGLTPITSYYSNINVAPGTKARLVPTITQPATFYTMKVWAIPSVD